MIDFKYHVVSLISVFLAIALGIVIGTTALNGGIVTNLQSNVSSLSEDKRSLEGRVTSLTGALESNSEFDAAVAPQLVDQTMAGQSFIVLTVGDNVTAELRDPVITMLQESDAQNTGAISINNSYTDEGQQDALLSFAADNVPPGVQVPATSDAATVVGSLLAAMLVPGADGAGQPGASVTTVLSGLGGLGVLSLDSTDITPSRNIVIVTSGATPDPAGQRNSSLIKLVTALDKAGASVVVVGDTASAGDNGLVGAIRDDAAVSTVVSTVDNVQYASGQLNTVWALVAERSGTSGHYGDVEDAAAIAPRPTGG